MAERKRGGQAGNKNALKHGFYSHAFDAFETGDISSLENNLDEEITLQRVLTRRVIEFAGSHQPKSLADWASLLGVFGQNNIRLAGLLKTRALLASGHDKSGEDTISQAIAQVVQEMASRHDQKN